MTRPILAIRELNLKVANQQLYHGLNFEVAPTGITALMGPVGVGKSSLLAWLGGIFDPLLFKADWQHMEYAGVAFCDDNRPPIFRQKAMRYIGETMKVIDMLLKNDPQLLCIDEVTARLPPDEADTVLQRLVEISQSRAVLMVSHNQQQVAKYAQSVLLVAGGIAQEHTPAKEFFETPKSDAGRQFVRTGGVVVVKPGTLPSHLRSDLREVPENLHLSDNDYSDGNPLRWAVENKLGVYTPQSPNGISNAELTAIKGLGIDTVVMVDGQRSPSSKTLADADLTGIWRFMPEGKLIPMPECKHLCRDMQRLLDAGEGLIVIANPDNNDAERTIGSQLVHMGLGADKAAVVAQSLTVHGDFDITDEQLFWDHELSNDLEIDALMQELEQREHDNQKQKTAPTNGKKEQGQVVM